MKIGKDVIGGKRIRSGVEYGGSRYREVPVDDFKRHLIWASTRLPMKIINVRDEKAVEGIAKSEEILTIEGLDNSTGRKIVIKGYTGYDPVRGSRYADALRIIGFYEVGGQMVPYGSATNYHLRTYHTKNWRKNLSKRLDKLYSLLLERLVHIHNLQEHVITEINSAPWRDKVSVRKGKDNKIHVKIRGFIQDRKEFRKIIRGIRSLGFRFNRTTKEWIL